jgi:hypothetical protein
MVSADDSRLASTTAPEPHTEGIDTRAWALTLAISLAAGLIAWGCSEMMLVPEIAHGKKGGPARVLPEVPASRNAMVVFGMLGAAIGLGLGLAGGLIRRSVLRAVPAAVLGLILGGLAGAGVSWLTLPVYYGHIQSNDLAYSLLVHGGSWTALGAAAGLAFGIGRGGWGRLPRCLLGAASAALLATIIYELAGMFLFPTAMTDRPLSKTSDTRLMAQLLVAGMVAAGALLSESRAVAAPRREPRESAVETDQTP